MPDGILPDEGIGDQLEYILRASISGVLPWRLILWVNDVEPDADTELADLTEATFGGYSAVSLTRATWTVPVVDAGCATSTWGTDAIVWYVTSGPEETVYGYAMYDTTELVLRFVQRFEPDDIVPLQVGGRLLLLPTYTLTSAACGGP